MELVLIAYSQKLRDLSRVKFMLLDKDALRDAISAGPFRVLREAAPAVRFPLDNFMRNDGGVDDQTLSEEVARALSEALIEAATSELRAEGEHPAKRIGAGELWIIHKRIPLPVLTLGAAQVHAAQSDTIYLLGQVWYGADELKNEFLAMTDWTLARSGETKKETIDVNSLPN